jgi:ketosteroid isomerase-like protein
MIFDMWQHGYQKGLKEWSAAIRDWFDSLKVERVNVDFEMIEVHESGDAGFASAVVIFQAVSGDDKILRSMKNRITLGLIKKDHVWRVKHQHTSAPIDLNLQAVLNF